MKPMSNCKAKFVQTVLEAVLSENSTEGRKTNIICLVSVDGKGLSSVGPPLRSSITDLKAEMPDGSLLAIQTIVLNISPSAIRFLSFEKNCVSAMCRVGGQETDFIVPMSAIMKVITPGHDDLQVTFAIDLLAITPTEDTPTEGKAAPKRPSLTVVK